MVVLFKDAPLSIVFIVALTAPWCRHLESLQEIFTAITCRWSALVVWRPSSPSGSCVKVVGQQILRSKCVLLSTAKTARNRMTTWRNQNIGCSLAVKLDVGDLGGRLDVTQRAPCWYSKCSG